jgi:hypothetical protein
MCRDILKLSRHQWTELFKALNRAPENEILDQIAYEISLCVDLDIPELKIREFDTIIRAGTRQRQLDEKTQLSLSNLNMGKLENIS